MTQQHDAGNYENVASDCDGLPCFPYAAQHVRWKEFPQWGVACNEVYRAALIYGPDYAHLVNRASGLHHGEVKPLPEHRRLCSLNT
jgi:hypothetical protein